MPELAVFELGQERLALALIMPAAAWLAGLAQPLRGGAEGMRECLAPTRFHLKCAHGVLHAPLIARRVP